MLQLWLLVLVAAAAVAAAVVVAAVVVCVLGVEPGTLCTRGSTLPLNHTLALVFLFYACSKSTSHET